MKRVGYLYDKMLDRNFIKDTIILASKHKTRRREVKKVLNDIDTYIDKIYKMLTTENIQLKQTHQRVIEEKGKERLITISPFFPNQVLDYMLVEITKPIIRKPMYQYCIGNVDKRGIYYGKEYLEKVLHKYKYYVKADIHHFYQNVRKKLLLRAFERKIKDKKFIHFIGSVIADDLPIGCYYSQWFSNFFLCELDHLIKEECHTPAYVRYVDDMVMCGNNKKKLLSTIYFLKKYLWGKDLELKYNPSVREVNTVSSISFIGFKFYADKVMLRNKIFKKLKKSVKHIGNHITNKLVKRVLNYLAWLKHTTYGYVYYYSHIRNIVKFGKLRYMASLCCKE